MKTKFSDKRWDQDFGVKVVSKSNLSKEELQKRAEKMKKRIEKKKYNGFDDTNIENDFKPKKSKEKIPNLPRFLEDKRKEESLKDTK